MRTNHEFKEIFPQSGPISHKKQPLSDEKTSAVACLPVPLSFFVCVLRPCYLRFQITKTKAFCKYTIFTPFQAALVVVSVSLFSCDTFGGCNFYSFWAHTSRN